MRKAFNDYRYLIHNNEFIGISLGYDFCAEHEWGIRGILNAFKIPEKSKKNLGIKSRTITKCPKNLLFKKEGKYAVLWVAKNSWQTNKIIEKLPDNLMDYKKKLDRDEKWNEKYLEENGEEKDLMLSMWDENGFAIAVKGVNEIQWLEILYNEFKKKNIAITYLNIGGNNPFANSSLSLLIVDKLPMTVIEGFYNTDKKYFGLIEYEKKIGMTKLKENKKGSYGKENYFMACSPRWIDYEDETHREKRKKELKTKYDIQYWINYSDDDHNYGWYTVEEIKKWLSTDGLKLTQVRKG